MDKVTDKESIICASCNHGFIPTRSDAQFCSSSCRQKAYRQKKPKAKTGLALRSELTPRQERFVEEYLVDRNATAAAVRAGYSKKSASQIASHLLVDVKVQENIRARGAAALAKIEVTEERTLQEVSAVGFSNIKDFLEWDKDRGLVVKDSKDIPDVLASAIESIEDQTLTTTNKDGTRTYTRHKLKVKLYPKLPALQLISEYIGLTDSMAPKVTVHLITGIDRTPLPLPEPEPEAVTVEAEPVVENPT